MSFQIPTSEQFIAAMVLGGVGDALGYKNGQWQHAIIDFSLSQLKELGGIDKIKISQPDFIVSDDTVMNIASANGLLKPAKTQDEMLQNLYYAYCYCLEDMIERGSGATCIQHLFLNKRWNYLPFGVRDGGCGAAMRGMAIGIRFWKPEMLPNLIIAALEGSRMTHHHPTGYLGGVVTALFTSYALQGVHLFSWGSKFRDEVLPLCKQHVGNCADRYPQQNLINFNYFENSWAEYLKHRNIADSNNIRPPIFPNPYGFRERDTFYKNMSFSGWGGASGHDSVIIAYDALLGAFSLYLAAENQPPTTPSGSGLGVSTSSLAYPPSSSPTSPAARDADLWRQTLYRAAFHSGDSNTTATIAAAWYGALFGFRGVPPNHYSALEYRPNLEKLGVDLQGAADNASDPMNAQWVLGEIH